MPKFLYFVLQCLCQLYTFSGICYSIFLKIFLFFLLSFPLSEPVPVSAIDNSFLQLLICLWILIFQKFSFLLFLLLLLGCFIVCVIIVAAAYIKLFVSVMTDSSSSKSSSIIPFISSLHLSICCFLSVLATFQPHLMPHYLNVFL